MGILKQLNIVKGSDTKAAELFESLLGDFRLIKYNSPHEYVNLYWNKYLSLNERNANLNGKVFEYIITTLLYNENLLPLYIQAQVAFVPNVDFDALLYSREVGPIALSMKTSLRERYKQADLEAIALKYVHRKAKAFLLTMEENEAVNAKNKIVSGDIIGLDAIVVCSGKDIDEMIMNLKNSYQYTIAGSVDIIKSSQVVNK